MLTYFFKYDVDIFQIYHFIKKKTVKLILISGINESATSNSFTNFCYHMLLLHLLNKSKKLLLFYFRIPYDENFYFSKIFAP